VGPELAQQLEDGGKVRRAAVPYQHAGTLTRFT